jgi:hypothetical protein
VSRPQYVLVRTDSDLDFYFPEPRARGDSLVFDLCSLGSREEVPSGDLVLSREDVRKLIVVLNGWLRENRSDDDPDLKAVPMPSPVRVRGPFIGMDFILIDPPYLGRKAVALFDRKDWMEIAGAVLEAPE